MSILREFVDDVRRVTTNKTSKHAEVVQVNKERALAAADFIDTKLQAAAAGGAATKGKKRPIRKRTKKAKARREYMRKYRANKELKSNETV